MKHLIPPLIMALIAFVLFVSLMRTAPADDHTHSPAWQKGYSGGLEVGLEVDEDGEGCGELFQTALFLVTTDQRELMRESCMTHIQKENYCDSQIAVEHGDGMLAGTIDGIAFVMQKRDCPIPDFLED